MIKNSILVILLLLLFLMPSYGDIPNPLNADIKSALYRTGKIDPKVKQIDPLLQKNISSDPQKYLPKLVSFFCEGSENDFHTVKRFHDWITLNIPYDKDRFLGPNKGSGEPYEILKIMRTTCGGYASLFKEMATLAGIESVYIRGYSKNYGKPDGSLGTHAWNGVKIDGKWYLIDITHDGRQSYGNGKLNGSLRPYKDSSLFINPEVKIKINFPIDERYQFVKSPMKLEEFKKLPQTSLPFYRYGLQFTDKVFINRLYKRVTSKEGWIWDKVADIVMAESKIVTLSFEIPQGVRFYVALRDENGKKYPLNAHHYLENSRVLFVFSAPTRGDFTATISGKFMSGTNSWTQLYRFKLIEKSGDAPLVIEENRIYTHTTARLYNLKSTNMDLTHITKYGYASITIEYSQSLNIVASLIDSDDKRVPNSVQRSIKNNKTVFYFALHNVGTYIARIYLKSQGAKPDYKLAYSIRFDQTLDGEYIFPPPQMLKH